MKIDLNVLGAAAATRKIARPYAVNRLDEARAAAVEAKAAGCGACLNDLAEATRIAEVIGKCIATSSTRW